MNKIVQTANFIWLNETPQPNDIAVFKKKFELKKIPESAETVISAETRYFLWINGKQAVYEGGLFRESMPGCGWADVINLAPFLKKGTNSIVIWVYYYGNGGRNNTRLSAAGLLFQCPSLNLFSDESFLCRKHPGFYTPGDPKPSYLYGGDNIGYNAVLDTDPCFESDEGFNPAVKIDSTVFGNLYQRPIPQFRLSEPFELTDLRYEKGSLTAALPHAMMVLPALSVQAKGGEILDVRTDHWETPGGPGGDDNRYHGHRLEFVCKPGINHFSSLIPLYGEKIVIQVPSAVQVLTVGYQETGYDCDITGSFHCSEPLLDRLVEKSARTLYVCMRDNFMDCPDRERGQWIGDISVQMSQVAFLLDERAMLLAKKAIHDFVSLRKGDILWGNVPGENSCELPSQSLAAISEWGLAAQYWKYTGDRETLSMLFEPAVRYLKLWELDERGLVISITAMGLSLKMPGIFPL